MPCVDSFPAFRKENLSFFSLKNDILGWDGEAALETLLLCFLLHIKPIGTFPPRVAYIFTFQPLTHTTMGH